MVYATGTRGIPCDAAVYRGMTHGISRGISRVCQKVSIVGQNQVVFEPPDTLNNIGVIKTKATNHAQQAEGCGGSAVLFGSREKISGLGSAAEVHKNDNDYSGQQN